MWRCVFVRNGTTFDANKAAETIIENSLKPSEHEGEESDSEDEDNDVE